jgi:3-oxoacyl-[acyl-carrier protein] reductase
MNIGLDQRVALVTGAGSGIGMATARALAREGCRIVLADVRDEALALLADELPAGAVPVVADVSMPASGKVLVEAAQAAFGRLDVLVCCAGVYETRSLATLDVEAWDRTIDVNLRGTFLCAQAAIPAMAQHGWGRIVTVSSIAARTGGMTAGPSYVASKAGVSGLTRSLAHAAGPLGITVNCVLPGIIETPMTQAIPVDTRRASAERAAVRRNGTAEEVADAIIFLASEAAGFVTGAHLGVNGGLLMD